MNETQRRLTASTITRTLSFGVGLDGSTPRNERKDFPDCCAIVQDGGIKVLDILILIDYVYEKTEILSGGKEKMGSTIHQ